MKEEIKQFLQSSLLEEYVLGVLAPEKVSEVERYIKDSPEVRKMYEELQESIAMLAKKMEILPPAGTKDDILQKIDQSIVSSSSTIDYKKWWTIAASMALLLVSIGLLTQYNQKSALQSDLNNLQSQYSKLQDNCNEKELLFAQQQAKWDMLANPKTERHILAGSDKAPNFETIAYWNRETQSSYLQIVSAPDLPKGKCLQLWADVDGKMINLNVIPLKEGDIVAIPYKENATSLNVTIEPDGGSLHPTVSDLIASVAI